jgi:hypothetical protein
MFNSLGEAVGKMALFINVGLAMRYNCALDPKT